MTQAVGGILSPFRVPIFRRIWPASLLSNFGLLIQGVGAAWTMTRLTDDVTMVALVQSALMLPMMLFSLPDGAISDMFDRRIVCLIALSIALAGAVSLSLLTLAGLLTPWRLLAFCFVVGAGTAMYGPSWQASVSEQVPPDVLPSAIALNGISFNLARSFGPAVGGVLVAAVGAIGAFVANALCYTPLLIVLLLWRRRHEPARLEPESFGRAILSGLRFVRYSPNHRTLVSRAFVFCLLGAAIPSLMPVVARDLLGGGATTYGWLLGAFGMGAVAGALALPFTRARMTTEAACRLSTLSAGGAILILAVSRSPALSMLALGIAGMTWTNALTRFSIAVQMSAPRWVAGRALAIFQSTVAAGVGFGSWIWGRCADEVGLVSTLQVAGLAVIASTAIGLVMRLGDVAGQPDVRADGDDPRVALEIGGRSGPIVMEIEYRVPPRHARAFYDAMQNVRRYRNRAGAYGWSISRDLADPAVWKERFHSPTWLDFMHLTDRGAAAEQVLSTSRHLLEAERPPVARRWLERPDGSVRASEGAPDPGLAMSPAVDPLGH